MITDRSSTPPDWKAITEAVARQLKGEPNAQLSNRRELRWGRRGSFQLDTDGAAEGRWKDWESGQGGRGAVSLAEYLLGTDRSGALDWLRQGGYLSERLTSRTPRKSDAVRADSQAPIKRAILARSIWASGSAIPRDESHPARRWFTNRLLWRPEMPTPPLLRWRAADSRHTGAGSILALLAPPAAWCDAWPGLPEPTAVQLVAVDGAGNPALDKPSEEGGLGKRTIGNAHGTVVMVGNPMLPNASAPFELPRAWQTLWPWLLVTMSPWSQQREPRGCSIRPLSSGSQRHHEGSSFTPTLTRPRTANRPPERLRPDSYAVPS